MAKNWESIGENQWKLTVSPDEGGPSSVFYGTRDEILDKLADSQANANRRITQLRGPVVNGNGHSAPPVEPRPLTANDRMQAVADLSNPATVDKAVSRVLESVIGPVDQFQRSREAERVERIERQSIAAVEEFCGLTPTYFASDYNNQTLVNYMMRMGYPSERVDSYQRAFAELSGAQLLQAKPQEVQNEDEPPPDLPEHNTPNPPRAASTRYSTGVRSSDISGTPPVPTKRLKFTREQIANMSAAEYKRHINDPEFARSVEFYSKPQRRPVAAAV